MKAHIDPILTISNRCNQNCIFCCTEQNQNKQSPREIEDDILSAKDTLLIGGWEPTLSKDLLHWVKMAKDRKGLKQIILRTNGVKLSNPDLARSLIEAGVTLFHVNFPSHNEKLSDALTRSKGSFRKRFEGVKNILKFGGGNNVALVFVISKFSYPTMPQYASFVGREFPNVAYIEFNLVCQLGQAKIRNSMVPKYTQIQPYLAAAAGLCMSRRIRFVMDDIPLCFMDGFEHASIDAYNLSCGTNKDVAGTKARQKQCRKCSLSCLCAGPKVEYVALHGAGELKPSRKSPQPIIKAIQSERGR